MNNWNKKNKACITLWSTLFGMQQLKTDFGDSGNLKMSELSFYNDTSDSEIIADRLDNVISVGTGVKYENGINRPEAVLKLIEVLSAKDNKVVDLAFTLSTTYAF
jgi:hypothetical protein